MMGIISKEYISRIIGEGPVRITRMVTLCSECRYLHKKMSRHKRAMPNEHARTCSHPRAFASVSPAMVVTKENPRIIGRGSAEPKTPNWCPYLRADGTEEDEVAA